MGLQDLVAILLAFLCKCVMGPRSRYRD